MPKILRRRSTLFAFALIAFYGAVAQAAPRAEDIFKSVGRPQSDASAVLPAIGLVVAGAAVLALLAWLSKRVQQRKGADHGGYNHPAKLLREVGRSVGLKRAEIRQLKLLADACADDAGGTPPSPLTLLLCPSVMAKAVARNPAKIDRQVLAGIVKQLSRSQG